MGIPGREIPPHVSRLMDPETRKELGLTTQEENEAAYCERTEKKEQSDFAGLLKSHRDQGHLIYGWAATNKASTNMPGTPDFLIGRQNRLLQIEFKAEGGRLSKDQTQWREDSGRCACDYWIVYSAREAYELLVKWLWQI